ncbi:hypothetical protein EV191_104205 [Tamaricihabitans halophyticus]|uniref:Transmembrane protein n=1 Tax=Tamaricihabitans halophyticus TaxID=1262583 RepID=A0A4R2QXC2_9PSEU|nr:hypothetical protein [Tamaricihabitans halophyticus]TCP53638.1 hypothetical protein EV191_104205 [Tamaricihabitans halophyticus]
MGLERVRRRSRLLEWVFRYPAGSTRRAVDRLESSLVVSALLIMIIAIPIAVAAGSATRDAVAHRAETSYQTQAVLLDDAPRRTLTEPGDLTTPDTRVRARWQTESGGTDTGKITSQPGMRAGERVDIWVDDSGRPNRQPTTQSMAVPTGVLTGLVSYFAIGMVVGLCVTALRWRLDRVRAAQWAHEWVLVAPIWSRQY